MKVSSQPLPIFFQYSSASIYRRPHSISLLPAVERTSADRPSSVDRVLSADGSTSANYFASAHTSTFAQSSANNRFEPDMLAFSGFYYGGGKKERREFGAIRRRWKTLHQVSNPDKERRHGKCPPTPEEVL
ncbi:O-fucosyltransferase 10-like [Cucumis melo]|uniref:O-fucosyltransferase 10-like n=1 Tax=Cucumis melo TaxID=3656 RepID=A0ABM3KRZ9_CUCME|nr:O-fucosyltransferase 10-like [Cucumis melo]